MDVQPRCGDVSAVERVRQRGFVDEVAACDVDYAGTPREQRDGLGSDDGGTGGGGQDQAVDVGKHGVQTGKVCGADFALQGRRFASDVVVEDGHSQGARALRDHEADVS